MVSFELEIATFGFAKALISDAYLKVSVQALADSATKVGL